MYKFTFEDIAGINYLICQSSSEPFGVNSNALYSALSVYDSYFETDELVLCALLRSIVCNHCFTNGNKRTGFMVARYCDLVIDVSDEQLQNLIMDIIQNHLTVDEIYKRLF